MNDHEAASSEERRRLSARFHADMIDGYRTLKREIGYNASRFLQMINEPGVGGEGAAHALLRGPDAHDGFTTLYLANRLHQSVEAWVLRPEYEPLFNEDERRTAADRLRSRGFDVDAYLRSLANQA
jgi:hypothetical protein